MSTEQQKKRIEQFFEGVAVNGIDGRTVHFDEDREGYIGVKLQSSVTDSMVYLSIPVVTAISSQDAVIAEILKKTVQPSECNDLARIVMLHSDRYNEPVYVQFQKYRDQALSQTTLSSEMMDRLCASWIAWRAKNYDASVYDDGSLGEIEDHPF